MTWKAIAAAFMMVWCVSAAAQSEDAAPTLADAQALVNQNKLDEASEMLAGIVEREPENGAAWFFYGYALHGSGELDKALEIHKKAASMTSGQIRATALYNMACAHSLKGHKDEALAALGEALEAGFGSAQNLSHMKTDPDLDNIRGMEGYNAVVLGAMHKALPTSYKQLDFWIGEWDVYAKNGQKLGENSIGLRDGAYIIDESWTGSGGGTGRSINYYDKADAVWKQVWVSGGGGVLEMSGNFKDGAMRFTGVNKRADGTKADHRTVLTPLDNGNVHQHIEESTDGETWSVVFDGVYVPKGSGAPDEWPDADEG